MARNHGNQHNSLRRFLLDRLAVARSALVWGDVFYAQLALAAYRAHYATAPASTRRRWKCGR